MTPDEIDALRRELEAEIADCRDDMGEHYGLCDTCKQHQRTLDALAALQQEQARLTAERDEARRFGEMAAARYNELVATAADNTAVTCAFCGEVYPPGTPRHGDGILAEHILTCQKHPIASFRERAERAEADAARLREALEELGTLCEIPPSAAKAVDGIIRRALAPAAPSTETRE